MAKSAIGSLRRADAPSECPLIGVDRKWLADRQTDANDPDRSSCGFRKISPKRPFRPFHQESPPALFRG